MEWQAPASIDNAFPYISLPPGLDMAVRSSGITGDYYLTIFVPSNSIYSSEDARTYDKLMDFVESNTALNSDAISQLARYGASSEPHNLSAAQASDYASQLLPMPILSTLMSTSSSLNDREDVDSSQLSRYSTSSEDCNLGAAPSSIPLSAPIAMAMTASASASASPVFGDRTDVISSQTANEVDDINHTMTNMPPKDDFSQPASYTISIDRNLGAAPTSASTHAHAFELPDNYVEQEIVQLSQQTYVSVYLPVSM